jgi:hypothetical protein
MQGFSLQISKVKILTNEHFKVDLTFIDKLKNTLSKFFFHTIAK